jgi:type 1 fimbriae regulatory protein FimB/type 1 fimbriae regulatory protein FimE
MAVIGKVVELGPRQTLGIKRSPQLGRRSPSTVFGKVQATMKTAPPKRTSNATVRGREYLTESEVLLLINAARKGPRHGDRDALMIRMMFRHGLRVSELVRLRRDQVNLEGARLHVVRTKRGEASTHPLGGEELRELRRLDRLYGSRTPYLFETERGGPFTPSAVQKIVARAGRQGGFPFPVHPHMLRHACGYKLANAGHDTRAIQHYLGHRNIQHTVRYTALDAGRFAKFWND